MESILIEYSQPSDDNILGIAESLHSIADTLVKSHGTGASMVSKLAAFHALWHLHQCLGELISDSAFGRDENASLAPDNSPN